MERVNIRRGWVLFLLGALIASSLCGARYFYLSQSKVQSMIERELEKRALQPENYKIERARVSFGSVLPVISIEFDSISVTANKCGQSEVFLKQVSLPLSWLELFQGNLFFSTMSIHDAQIKRIECPPKADVKAETGHDTKTESNFDQGQSLKEASEMAQEQLAKDDQKKKIIKGLLEFKHYFNSAFHVDFLKVKQLFNLITIDHLAYYRDSKHLFSLKKLILNLEESDINGNWDLVLSQDILKKQPLKEIRSSFNIDFNKKNINLNTTTLYKEGRIYADFTYRIDDLALKTKSELKYLPGYYIFNWLRDFDILNFEVEPQWIWFNCKLNSDIDFDEPKSSFLKFNSCGLMGDLVDVKLPELTVYPWSKVQFQPFNIHFQKVELEKLLKGMGQQGPKGLLTNYGTLSGVVRVDSPKKFNFQGQLKDVGLYFVRQGLRGKQKIPFQAVNLTYEDGRFSGLIKDAELDKGVLDGEMSFNFNTSFTEGVIQMRLDKVGFHPSIQQLLVEGELAPLSILGKGIFQDGQMVGWEGALGTASIKGPKYEANQVTVKALFAEGHFEAWWKVKGLSFYKGNLYYKWLEPLWLNKVPEGEPLQINDMEVKLIYVGRRGQWQRFKATANGGDVLLASSGSWSKDFKVRGALHLDNKPLKLLKWDIAGTMDDPSVVPSPQLLLDLRERDANMTVPPGLSVEDQVDVVKNYLIKLQKTEVQ